jgi:outer membrane receptor protein involved in Fe transport
MAALGLLLPSGASGFAGGRIEGRVFDPAGLRLPGVSLTLTADSGGFASSKTSGAQGEFVFAGVPPGAYQLTGALSGYAAQTLHPVVVVEGKVTEVRLDLLLAVHTESLTIAEQSPPADISNITEADEFSGRTVELLPLGTDSFLDALPLLPGVLRGPDGKLNFNGTRASQSSLLVNGANVTDPLTGDFAIELPLSAVETVKVTSLPYSAEYGHVSAAVTEVITRAGADRWRTRFSSVIPKPRFRNGTVMGIGSATPNLQVSGPLSRGRAWFSQAFTYRFIRTRAYDIPAGEDEELLRSFDTFTQFDLKLNDRHSLTATFSYFPVSTDNLDLDSLNPAEATPDFQSWGWNLAIAERASLSARTLLETTFALKSYDVAVRPKTTGETRLTVEGLRENYFNQFDRQSQRAELNVALSRSVEGRGGRHLMKVGAQLAHSDFSGVDRSGPVAVLGADGRLRRRIEFSGEGTVGAANSELGGFFQDRWQITPRLSLDAGVRYDYDRLSGSHHPVPRFAVAYSPFREEHTLLRGGWGIFYDRLYVHAGSFERFQRRRETDFGPDGSPSGASLYFENRVAPRGLRVPRSQSWNVEFNRRLGPSWMIRVNFAERKGSHELTVDRMAGAPEGPALVLSSRGRSMSRQFDVTLRRALPRQGELLFSYSHLRSRADLNSFESLYGNSRSPLILASEYSLQAFDVPHRLLCWGIIKLPWGIDLAPALELRNGFPYTVFDETWSVVGGRNRAGRYPKFFSADLRLTKEIRLFGRRLGVGFQLFNITSHFNPRDLQRNQASPYFGRFANSPNASFGFRLQLGGND